jgi:uncharacterized membrane protein
VTALKTPSPDVLEYLQAVRATLADLPPEERDELMVDVESALLEAAEENDDPLAMRLGPPQTFAADLRAAAGLEEPPAPAPAPAPVSAAARLRDAVTAALAGRRAVATRRVAIELAPIWWVVRAFVAFAAVALLLGARTSVLHPWMPVVGDTFATFALLGLVLAGSLWLGLRHRRTHAILAADLLLLLCALPLALYLAGHASTPVVHAATPSEVQASPVRRIARQLSATQQAAIAARDRQLLRGGPLVSAASRLRRVVPAIVTPGATRRILRVPGSTMTRAVPMPRGATVTTVPVAPAPARSPRAP